MKHGGPKSTKPEPFKHKDSNINMPICQTEINWQKD